jgi:hypothetical protein
VSLELYWPTRAIADLRFFAPISLAELETDASLLTRTDRKYIVPRDVFDDLAAQLYGSSRVLDIEGLRRFRYRSVYFDTPELLTYLAAARSRPRRFKVRTRTYVDSGLCSLEVKVRDHRGRTVKHRLPYDPSDCHRLTDEARRFLDAIVGPTIASEAFVKVLTTEYTRSTLVLGDGASRLTVDIRLRCMASDGRTVSLEDDVLIETKSLQRPTEADHLLWGAHHRPVRVSKYSTALAALRPELPSNKWTPVLRDHFQHFNVLDLRDEQPAPTPHVLRWIGAKLLRRVPFAKTR